MKIIETKLDGTGLKIAIIQARFNGFISDALLSGAEEGLVRHGVETEAITVFKVPGSLEVPLVLKRVASSGAFDGAICLGAVIKGDTAHFDLVIAESAKGIQSVMLDFDFPVSNGIITTNSLEQAIERAGVKSGNKGFDAAMTLLDLIQTLRLIP
jgi:6,7-dimethyl-8-ribityllumazine synthase